MTVFMALPQQFTALPHLELLQGELLPVNQHEKCQMGNNVHSLLGAATVVSLKQEA